MKLIQDAREQVKQASGKGTRHKHRNIDGHFEHSKISPWENAHNPVDGHPFEGWAQS